MSEQSLRRRVCYVTGTRADFGLMESTLRGLHQDSRLLLSLIVTGTHLSARHGSTVHEIEALGLEIAARIPIDAELATGAAMAVNIGRMLIAFVEVLQRTRPDVLLLLGDRGEMLAGALAAAHLGIAIAHIHGGERSGSVDEPVRHAISRFANLHLVANEAASDRLIRMGERGSAVHIVGAPGLDGLTGLATIDRVTLCQRQGLENDRAVALLVYHPVLSEAAQAGEQIEAIVRGICEAGVQVMALMPNSDGGANAIRLALQTAQREGLVSLATHFERREFISWMAACDVMVGNSSSGIIEAATFGTPVLNVGSRQNLREQNSNVIDVAATAGSVSGALRLALQTGRFPQKNIYGDGRAGSRILETLATVDLSPQLLSKCNAF